MRGREPKPHRKHTAVRVADQDLARLERVRSELSTEWHDATMSEVLRLVLVKGIEIMEREHLARRARSRARGR